VSGHRARRSAAVELTCIPGGAGMGARAAMGAWGALGEALWPAWSRMAGSEMCVYDVLGEEVGEKLLVLWAISRFGEGDATGTALAELVDATGRPRFGDPLVEDMMLAAFALGAAWMTGQDGGGAVAGPPAPRLRVASAGGAAH
jgi:hypothetical protein